MMPNLTASDMLDFPKRFQVDLLRHLIMDEEFYHIAEPVLEVNDLDFPPCQTIYDALRTYYKQYGSKPILSTLDLVVTYFAETGGNDTAPIRLEERPAFNAVWDSIKASATAPLDIPYFKQNLVSYLRRVRWNTILRDAQASGVGAIEHSLEKAQALGQLETTSVLAEAFTDAWKQHVPLVEGQVFKVPTHLASLNRAIHGGLGLGEMGMIMACPGVGKTNTLINFACAAAMISQIRCLFFTFELSKQRIEQRYQAMTAHIYASSLKTPIQQWSDDELGRWAFMREHSLADGLNVVDLSRKEGGVPVKLISDYIHEWKKIMYNRYGQDMAQPLLVCVDWLHPDYIIPNNVSRTEKQHIVMASISKQIAVVGKSNNVALWSACQGNRSADGKIVLAMRDTAGAYDINQPVDVGIGIAAVQDLSAHRAVFDFTTSEDDDAVAGAHVGSGRELVFASVKTRDAMPFQFKYFQGPTLKIWPRKADWTNLEKELTVEAGLPRLRQELGLA